MINGLYARVVGEEIVVMDFRDSRDDRRRASRNCCQERLPVPRVNRAMIAGLPVQSLCSNIIRRFGETGTRYSTTRSVKH